MVLKAFITRGLQASGKSTKVQEMIEQLKLPKGSYVISSNDRFTEALFGASYVSRKGIVDKLREMEEDTIRYALENRLHLFVDNTHLPDESFVRVYNLIKRISKEVVTPVEVKVIDCRDVPLNVCLERNSQRPKERQVPVGTIKNFHEKYIQGNPNEICRKATVREPDYSWKFPKDDLPTAIICDLDGTLSLLNGRNPYDASTCNQDIVNKPVRDIVQNEASNGTNIIFLSGRNEKYRPETLEFINKAFDPKLTKAYLFMRGDGDDRKDSVVKKELFQEFIEGIWNVKYVLDDRNQVVDMWRKDLQIACLQVEYGDF